MSDLLTAVLEGLVGALGEIRSWSQALFWFVLVAAVGGAVILPLILQQP